MNNKKKQFLRLFIVGYYVAYKPTVVPCILFILVKLKCIHYRSCDDEHNKIFEMCVVKFMSMCKSEF